MKGNFFSKRERNWVGCRRCGHVWDYKGSARYILCPRCKTSRKPKKIKRFY